MTGRNALSRVVVLVIPILLFALSSVAVAPAFADELTLLGCGNNGPTSVSSGGATVPCNTSYTNFAGVLTSITSTETGNLSTGTMGVVASVLDPPGGSGGSIIAIAEINYVFSVGGVTNGTAAITLTANGTLSGNAYPGGVSLCNDGGSCGPVVAELEYSFEDPVYINGALQPGGRAILGGGLSNILIDTPITNGTAVLDLTLFENVSCIQCGVTSTADFLDPVSITGASALDANGNPVSATFISESGFNPNAAAGVPAPEPSSIVLMLAGCLAMSLVALKGRLA